MVGRAPRRRLTRRPPKFLTVITLAVSLLSVERGARIGVDHHLQLVEQHALIGQAYVPEGAARRVLTQELDALLAKIIVARCRFCLSAASLERTAAPS